MISIDAMIHEGLCRGMIICGKCGKNNPEDSRFCNSCGSRFELHEVRPAIEMIPGEQPCPRCGSGVPPYMDFCPKCATSLTPLRQLHEPERRCSKCGRILELGSDGSTVCPVCIWDRADSENVTQEPKSGDRPIIVGVLLSAVFILSMISSIPLLLVSGNLEDTSPIDVSGFVTCCLVIIWFASISALLGAILSFRRSNYTLVVLAAAFGMLSIGPFYLASLLSLIAMIIAALSKDDYRS